MKGFTLCIFLISIGVSSLCLGAGSFGGLVVPNMGQVKNGDCVGTVPVPVQYYMDAPWGRLYVTEQGLLLNIIEPEKQGEDEGPEKRGLAQAERSGDVPVPAFPRGNFDHPEPRIVHQTGILLDLPGACWREVIPEDPQVTKLNFFYGNDPKSWVTDVPTYGRLRIKSIFPGTDLVIEPKSAGFWRTEGGLAELPGLLEGQAKDKLHALGIPLDNRGFFSHLASLSPYRSDWTPNAIRANGQREAQTLLWGTYLGGTTWDEVHDLAMDDVGDIIAVGITDSHDFPVQDGWDVVYNGDFDIFAAKLSADGKRLLWGTYIGGSDEEYSNSIALDAQSDIVIAGSTSSPDVPTTPGAFDTTYHGGGNFGLDIYMAKLSAEGNSLLWGTYIGGAYGRGDDEAYACAVNRSGDVVLAGYTGSSDIPVPGGFDTEWGGNLYKDMYIAKLSGDGSALLWATYLGGSNPDGARAMVLDASENIIVGGTTGSPEIPVPGGYDTTLNYGGIYIAKISIADNKVLWGTFIEGSYSEIIASLNIDTAGSVYLFGTTDSVDLPTPGGYDSGFNGIYDYYIAKLSADGNRLLWGTYLGGNSYDEAGWGPSLLDADGNIIIAGSTMSPDMPVPAGYDPEYLNACVYVAKISSSSGAIVWGTYLGGAGGSESPAALLRDRNRNIVVAGWTTAPDFPVSGAYDSTYNGPDSPHYADGFIVNLSDPDVPPVVKTLHVAAAARTPGAQGTSWRTDGMVLNPGTTEVCYDLHYFFLDAAQVMDTLCEYRCLAAQTAWSYSDILGTACGVEAESAGSLRIEPTGKLLMTTRTYNQTAEGTFGQFIKAAASDEGLAQGEKGHLIALKQNAEYRTNLGFTEITGQETEVEIRIYNASGSLLQTTNYQLPAAGWLQVGLADLGIYSLEVGRAEIEVVSGGAVLSYASVVDNRTGDAIYVPAQLANYGLLPDHQLFPVVAHTSGAYGTRWRSDIWMFNPKENGHAICMYYKNAPEYKCEEIASSELLELGDIVASLFPEAGDGAGSLWLVGAGGVVMLSRTYTSSEQGTYGQFIPSNASTHYLSKGERAWLSQLQCNSAYRTNVGFTDYSGEGAVIELELHAISGAMLGSGTITIPGNMNIQIDDVFSALGVSCASTGAYATVENLLGGAVYGYASVVDNRTGDAIFISAME